MPFAPVAACQWLLLGPAGSDLLTARRSVHTAGIYGGEVANATCRNHGHHAAAIGVHFDPTETSDRTLLEFFFQIHGATTLDRQGHDRGARDRSAIFSTSDEQKDGGFKDTIADVEAPGLWPGKMVSEVVPASDFRQAEPEYQDYLERIGYTCHFVRPGWKLPQRADPVETPFGKVSLGV